MPPDLDARAASAASARAGKAPRRRWLARTLAVTFGLLPAVVAAELLARILPAGSAGGAETAFDRGHLMHPRRGFFLLDGEEGYRPAPGHPAFAHHGALKNEYPLARTGGVPRVLCMGDSVTYRAFIVNGLAARAPHVEWWNAGVEGWNTRQQAAYLERICDGIQPDFVVVFLHLNDFEITPVRFVDDEGRFIEFRPSHPRELARFWFVRSALYRRWVGWTERPAVEQDLAAEVFANLARMRAHSAAHNARFAVVMLPPFAAPGELPQLYAEISAARTRNALAWLMSAGIPHFELASAVAGAAATGLPVGETPGDVLHPSPAAGDACAESLIQTGLLELLPAPKPR